MGTDEGTGTGAGNARGGDGPPRGDGLGTGGPGTGGPVVDGPVVDGRRADGEWARHWRSPHLPDLHLLSARYVRHTFPRHAHDGYVLGAVTRGVEEIGLPGGGVRAVPGTIAMINPEVPHSARAAGPEGWAYATLYPGRALVGEVAAEWGVRAGGTAPPLFRESLVVDPEAARTVVAVHRAAEAGQATAADTLLRGVVARLVTRYAAPTSARTPAAAGARAAELAREILTERMADPPTLAELAGELGTGSFALLRAFRARYGMPPHTWLTDARVRRARVLMERGTGPAAVAALVGFSDQPHLNRHFTRIVGVPPGAYRREHGPTEGGAGARDVQERTRPRGTDLLG
ncbi:AraC family transcriptional regulator [Streptomyces sp. BI20]|uniref:AraC family transcriptional regulator n=1 Tax=Streptomyces sp. BI20 TaxID=3403460 RepID=UPI003C74FF70